MKCMRCASVVASGAVFCQECLADMEKHPVKPGTPINLPRREKVTVTKRSKKRAHKPEEQVSALRRLVIWLISLVIILVLALTATVYMLVDQHNQAEGARLPDQNYGTIAGKN